MAVVDWRFWARGARPGLSWRAIHPSFPLPHTSPRRERRRRGRVAHRFREAVETHFSRREAAGAPVSLTVSGGVACYPDDARSAEALLERAARALYTAKAAGKNTASAFTPERRRYLRFELGPGRFEVEVLERREFGRCRARDASRNGILFASPEPLDVGEAVEIRLTGAAQPGAGAWVRGRVVRLEEVPAQEDASPDHPADRYEVGVALAEDGSEAGLLALLERVRSVSAPGRV